MDIKNTIEQIRSNAEKIHETYDWIKKMEEEFRQATRDVKDEVYSLQKTNEKLLAQPVRVKATDLRKVVAEGWNCAESDVRIWCSPLAGSTKPGLNMRSNVLDGIEGKYMQIHCANKSGRRSFNIGMKVNGESLQADGRTLREHFRVRSDNQVASTDLCYAKVEYDDLRALVIEVPLSDLVWVESSGNVIIKNNGYAKPMMKAALTGSANKSITGEVNACQNLPEADVCDCQSEK